MPDRNGKAESEHHAIQRERGVLDHGAVGEHGNQGAHDGGYRRQQGGREIAAACQQLIEGRRAGKRDYGANDGTRALSLLGHDVIIPHRTTV